ncbi:MAG: 2-oxoglutarate dehydrogenase complex dihydrolipoyllysine-residue succinyltransferase [Gammaproteobacteria bacterium]|nr:2-oxoglutarate dehydrogenase complex dihydrolipoyllysine-residue succinyltransferase [Gammaproteobacteria bacterium]MDH3768272.1 2-oxoglutarate dehydrogenase complex dihydrolipoyllysine-residue succinyltransferase [Gammaproteobacteria bacterium]
MSIEVKVPQLPESVSDATLLAWHKKPGDAVTRDENLVDLETDKVVLEVPAPTNGVIKAIHQADGTTVKSGELLATLEAGDAPVVATSAPATPADAESESATHKLSPSVRRLVEEHNLDPATITGTGRDGRISKSDVLAHLDSGGAAPPATEQIARPAPAVPSGERNERRVPMTRLRARIAERLVEAQQTAAMLTSFNEVDLGAVIALRKKYRDSFKEKHGVKLGYMSFFIKAAIEALRKFPAVNASVDGKEILYHDYFDIGIAVSTERGLVVPVLRNVDQMSYAGIERAIVDYATRARNGSISLDDLTGGTFTITNGGTFGSLMSTPIINPPQSAILGMHTIQERAMVVDGEVKVRPMMYIALTYDHRIIDGREAVLTLVAIKEALEFPASSLLEI